MSERVKEFISNGTILLGYRGSISHGTYRPSTESNSIDDIDYMGIVIPGKEHYLGLKEWSNHGTRELFEGEIDLCEYELKKFIGLLLKCNPNVHCMLFLKPEHYLILKDAGKKLIDRRDEFATKYAYHSYCGYANGQLKKMESIAFQGYLGDKRRELVKKHGYDTKNAAHCIRILRLGIEFLKTGQMQVDRTDIDREEILSIKDGAWSTDRVVREASILVEEAREAYESSNLPERPNFNAANKICQEIIEETLFS